MSNSSPPATALLRGPERSHALGVLCTLALWIAGLPLSSGSAEPIPTITHGRDVRTLGDEAVKEAPPVRLRGVVLHRYPTGPAFILQDDSDAVFVDLVPSAGEQPGGEHAEVSWPTLGSPRSASAGDLPEGLVIGAEAEVEGVASPGHFAPIVLVSKSEKIRVVGTAAVPAPQPLTAEAACAGLLDAHRVVAEGVVRRAPPPVSSANPALEMVFESTRLFVYLKPTEEGWSDLVDARIRVTGVSSGIWNRQRQITAPCLMATDRRDITVLRPAPADPFALPARSVADILRYRPEDAPGHRIRVTGVVLHALQDGRVFVCNGDSAVCAECATAPTVVAGDAVDAVGFPTMRGRSPLLEDAVLRSRGHQALLPKAVRRDPGSIIEECKDYELVRVEALLLETQRTEGGIDLLLQGGDRLFKATVDGVRSAELLTNLRSGSTLAISGLVLLSFPSRTTQASRPNGFSLLARSPADIRLLRQPSWWTVRRLLGMLGAAVGLVLAFALWNHFLRARAKAQRDIIRAQTRREATSEERARLARELHDTLEQEFVGMTRQTEALEHAGSLTSPAREALEVLRQMLRLSRENARRAVWDLRDPALLGCGLEVAVRNAVERIVRDQAVAVNFHAEMSAPAAIPPQVQVNILRLAQEAVANAAKHSDAKTIEVALKHVNGTVELRVMNDGQRAERIGAHSGAAAGHFGIIGMRERCEKLGGHFEFHAHPGGGASVCAQIPVPPER